MARRGGQSTVMGISFQALAIARSLIDVHQGQADFVQAEVPPRADFGQPDLVKVAVDDYVVQRSGIRTYYQAKSNAPSGGLWTLKKLSKEEILQKFAKQVEADTEAKCCLVTPCSCPLFADLAELARQANCNKEFLGNLGKKQLVLFDETCKELDIDQAVCWKFLCHCWLEIRTSDQLRGELETLAQAMFADSKCATDSLFALASSAMEKSQRLDKASLEQYFTGRAVFVKPKVSEVELLDAIRNASSRLRSVGKDIAGVHVLQPTVHEVFDWVAGSGAGDGTVAVFLDQAGSGKTVAMSVLLNRLEAAGYKVLGIKVDGLAFSNHDELATTISLPATIPSTVQSLHASGHRVAVLIDQVDALSSAMSRESSAITVVLDLVARLASLGRVPIVLACRSFDWKYDHRLRTLRNQHPKEFSIPELTDDQLGDVLSVLSLKQVNLNPLTIKVIRCPLRLRVFADVVNGRRSEEPTWSPSDSAIYTLQMLYQEFWNLTIRKAKADGIASVTACEAVVANLAQYMHDSEHLAAPMATAAAHRPSADWLISQGILTENGKSLAFFHQTFFDFVFARRFVQTGRSLVGHLLSTDQGLFYRPMTRQILEYIRDTSPKRYLVELKGILENSRIRKHLRWLTIVWLGQLPDPRPEELDLLEPFLSRTDYRRRILMCLRENPAWFDLLTPERFRRWLESLSESECGSVIWYLQFILHDRPMEITSLLSPHVDRDQAWNSWITSCLAYVEKGWGDCTADLLMRLLGSPLIELYQDRNSMPHWAMAIKRLTDDIPAKGCEAVGAILQRSRLQAVIDRDKEKNVTTPHGRDEELLPATYNFMETLISLSNKVPRTFLDTVLPWTLSAMSATCYSHSDLCFKDNWRYWNYENPHRDSPTEKLLVAIGTASKSLAGTSPDAFRVYVHQMLAGDFLPMQYIIAEAYEACAQEFAADAADFFCADSRRLCLGLSGNPVWVSTRLIGACCPYWSQKDFSRVEIAILSTKEWKAESVSDMGRQGLTHLQLLLAMDREKLSDQGKDRLGQLERKFPEFKLHPPKDFGAVWVGPPIAQDNIEKMTDDGWLGAMKRYVTDRDRERWTRTPELSGGRIQLSRALQAQAKEKPERFYRLALEKMDESYHPDYVAAILEGIAEAEAPTEHVEGLIEKYRDHLEDDNIRPMCSAMERYAGTQVPKAWIRLLERWATTARDPDKEDNLNNRSLVDSGLNTDRGHTVWTLAKILLQASPPQRTEYLNFTERIISDPSVSVRAVCIQFLQYSIPVDPYRACDLFKQLIGKDQVLLRERGSYDCVYQFHFRHADRVLWAITLMLADSESADARENGSRLACLAAFNHPDAQPLRDLCLSGDATMRKGAAAIYSANVANPEIGEECRQRLQSLMNDKDHEVRRKAAGFLRRFDDCDLREMSEFLREWSYSESIDEGADNAAYMLKEHSIANPELTLDLAGRLIEVIGQEMTNMQTRHGMISFSLTPAILNIYHRSLNKDVRNRAIALFEKLEELGCPEVSKAFEAVDRM